MKAKLFAFTAVIAIFFSFLRDTEARHTLEARCAMNFDIMREIPTHAITYSPVQASATAPHSALDYVIEFYSNPWSRTIGFIVFVMLFFLIIRLIYRRIKKKRGYQKLEQRPEELTSHEEEPEEEEPENWFSRNWFWVMLGTVVLIFGELFLWILWPEQTMNAHKLLGAIVAGVFLICVLLHRFKEGSWPKLDRHFFYHVFETGWSIATHGIGAALTEWFIPYVRNLANNFRKGELKLFDMLFSSMIISIVIGGLFVGFPVLWHMLVAFVKEGVSDGWTTLRTDGVISVDLAIKLLLIFAWTLVVVAFIALLNNVIKKGVQRQIEMVYAGILASIILGAIEGILWNSEISFDPSTKWGLAILLAHIGYLLLSFGIVNETKLGAIILMGRPLCQVRSGLVFVPFLFCRLRRETRNVIQEQFPDEPDNIYTDGEIEALEKVGGVPTGDGQKTMPWRIVHANSDDVSNADDVSNDAPDSRKRKADGPVDPIARRLTTHVVAYVRYQIKDYIRFLKVMGKTSAARDQIRDALEAVIQEELAKRTPAKTYKDLGNLSKKAFKIIEGLVKETSYVDALGNFVQCFGLFLSSFSSFIEGIENEEKKTILENHRLRLEKTLKDLRKEMDSRNDAEKMKKCSLELQEKFEELFRIDEMQIDGINGKILGAQTVKSCIKSLGSHDYNKEMKDWMMESWGINVLDVKITSIKLPKRVNEALADASEALLKKEVTITEAEAEEVKLTKEGAGLANARKAMLVAESIGLKKVSEIMKTDEGKAAYALQQIREALQNSNYSYLTPDHLNLIAGIDGIDFSSKSASDQAA